MEFRLTYDGVLFATQNDPLGTQWDKRADHKHHLREGFHKQLKRLWKITPYLSNPEGIPHLATRKIHQFYSEAHDIPTLAAKHAHYGFNFVPLVTVDMDLLCGLDVLFLRPDRPGGVIWAGDIDNRVKTLIDALRLPSANERYDQRSPTAEQKPFFCLLEDDKLVTKLSIETDQLLEFDSSDTMNEVRLIVTVKIRPYQMHMGNLEFGG